MAAITTIFMYLILGFFVGVANGFIREWYETLYLVLLGLMIAIVIVLSASMVLTGAAGATDPLPWYEYVGFVLYALGIWSGDTAGQVYYSALSDACQ